MFVVEKWISHEYPSRFSWDANFSTLEEAVAYIKNQSDPSDYRVIRVMWGE